MTKLAEMWYLNLSSNNLSRKVTPLLGKMSSNTTTGDGHSGKTRLVLAVTLSLATALLVSMVVVVCTVSRKARRAADVVIENAETAASGGSSAAATTTAVQASLWSKDTTFSFGDILAATEHFNDAYCIGRGSFGTVYRADLSGGRAVAMKQLDVSETGDACCSS
ncbi:Os02g0468900 [Oryza sativa Japonica Group]|uniref:non-specific serine/threonine protein kinase n=1 Tax=Oryza sativa subsp. japonica TaxID=39947 RepID=A0A0P0VJ00_ORYSJ|nr:Os02g0468900 [Oryza sativa Japonica Group]